MTLQRVDNDLRNRDVLISGAGIAGLTLAFWLHKFGFRPVIVEQRSNVAGPGYMIDFYGSGFDVAEKMGLIDRLRERHCPIPTMRFVNDRGTTQATIDVDRFRQLIAFRHFNFLRGDLADVLHDAIKDDVPLLLDTGVRSIGEHDERLRVELSDGSVREADLIVGADGIHSNIRRLCWGPEENYARFLNHFVACGITTNIQFDEPSILVHVEPGTQAMVYSVRSERTATMLAFKGDAAPNVSPAERLREAFRGQGWLVPQLVEETIASRDFYFDAVTQIEVPQWHRGRVALVGDACQCLTLLAGQGASLAMAGAYILATELSQSNGDFETAFRNYQNRLKPQISDRQARARKMAETFVPKNRFAVWKLIAALKFGNLPVIRSLVLRSVGAESIIH